MFQPPCACYLPNYAKSTVLLWNQVGSAMVRVPIYLFHLPRRESARFWRRSGLVSFRPVCISYFSICAPAQCCSCVITWKHVSRLLHLVGGLTCSVSTCGVPFLAALGQRSLVANTHFVTHLVNKIPKMLSVPILGAAGQKNFFSVPVFSRNFLQLSVPFFFALRMVENQHLKSRNAD